MMLLGYVRRQEPFVYDSNGRRLPYAAEELADVVVDRDEDAQRSGNQEHDHLEPSHVVVDTGKVLDRVHLEAAGEDARKPYRDVHPTVGVMMEAVASSVLCTSAWKKDTYRIRGRVCTVWSLRSVWRGGT
jgi:hypothetical protein